MYIMVKYLKSEYKFVKFEKGKGNKKYSAVLRNKKTKREVKVQFGDKNYQQYRDSALGLYKSKDHLDKKRRDAYRSRHSKEVPSFKDYYSPGFFAYKFLWS